MCDRRTIGVTGLVTRCFTGGMRDNMTEGQYV